MAMEADPDNNEIAKAHEATFSYSYWTWMDVLNGHQHTTKLFEVALRDSTSWPVNDIAVKQEFQTKTPLPHPVTKTGWDMTFFVVGLDKSDNVEMDEMSWSDAGGSEWSDNSDQMMVADDSEVSNSSLLPEMCNSDFMFRSE